MPTALVNFVTENVPLTRACVGIDLTRTDNHLSFCARTILQDTPLVVPDLESDPEYAGHPLVVPNGPFRFYAGAPFIRPDGQRIGTLCVLDYQAHHDVTPDDSEALVSLAGPVMDELELRLGLRELQRELDANASLSRHLKESQQMSGALLGVGALLDLELPLHEVAEQAIALIARAANADWGTLVSLTGNSLVPVAHWTRTASQQLGAEFPLMFDLAFGVTAPRPPAESAWWVAGHELGVCRQLPVC